jgi:hypothetical protein
MAGVNGPFVVCSSSENAQSPIISGANHLMINRKLIQYKEIRPAGLGA